MPDVLSRRCTGQSADLAPLGLRRLGRYLSVACVLLAVCHRAPPPKRASPAGDHAEYFVYALPAQLLLKHYDLGASRYVIGGMRLTSDGRQFRILIAHDPDELRRWTECLAEEEGR